MSVVFEVDPIWEKPESTSHLVLGYKRPYSLVALLTSLNGEIFFGAKMSDN